MQGSFGECPHCHGAGLVRSTEALALSNLRKLWLTLSHKKVAQVKATLNLSVANYLLNRKRNDLMELEDRYKTALSLRVPRPFYPMKGISNTSPGKARSGLNDQTHTIT